MKILVLTKIYPADDIPYSDTPVVHYFARQWQKMGHEVKVVHNLIQFPKILSRLTYAFLAPLTAKVGSVIPSFYDNHVRQYIYDRVEVLRIPFKKLRPHGQISHSQVAGQFGLIVEKLDECGFKPDVVVGHWWSPQLELLGLFKQKYGCKTCLVLHDVDKNKAKNSYQQFFCHVDIWGMRSIPILNQFETLLGKGYKTFHCPSGIPSRYIVGNHYRNFHLPAHSICYVGSLIKRKHPLALMQALKRLPDDEWCQLRYVGAGGELEKLRKYAQQHFPVGIVSFTEHKIPRDEVSKILKQSDVFVMISHAEAFGLVYLEAMGAGCITVASRNEGMEGIIIHGKNGFLCEAGNDKELAEILAKIKAMSVSERKKMSDLAVETAQQYTDYLAAQRYIETVINC